MPPSLTLPKVIGHRGAKAYAPENTLSSIYTAADIGTEWVHLNVKLTKDSQAVVFGDEDLARTTNGSGAVADMTLEQLRELDAGSWFSDSFFDEKVPTLEDALIAVIDRGMGLILEISPTPGAEVETAEVALDVLTRNWPDDVAAPLIASQSHVSLETARDMIPEYPRAFIMAEPMINWREFVDHLDAAAIIVDADQITEEMVEEYIEAQKPIIASTVNSPDHARQLIRWGVDAFISDRPDSLREEIETRH